MNSEKTKTMESNRKKTEKEVIDLIKNPGNNPYICLSDITGHLFLLNPIRNNPSKSTMNRKYRAKKHQAKSIIDRLLFTGKIKIDNQFLMSYK